MTSIAELDGWIPFRVYFQEAAPTVDWCYLGSEILSAPFFNQTINDCLHKPSSLLFRHKTSIDTLVELGSSRPGLYPSGFIFHMSRCGSTLVGQMLASLPDTAVISEAPPIDFVISAQLAGTPVATEERIRWLQALVNSLGQRRKGNERHYFIKFDAWHILHWPLIRRAFPDVPWIFLYRDPIEVMVSQLRQRGIHMIPGAIDPCLFQMEANAELTLTPEEYCARVLASTCEAGLRHHHAGGLLVNYSELPEAAYSFFPEFFRLLLTDVEHETMLTAAKLNAKNPSIDFETDSARKQEMATVRIREAAEKWLYPVYERLERARLDSSASPPNKMTAGPDKNLIHKIVGFLGEIGIEVCPAEITEETFLPGILVDQGKILFDETRLGYPGDLLHEAGHLAVAPAKDRANLSGEVNLPAANMDVIESAAMAWSYAAALHLGLDPEVVFHKDGYKGNSQGLLTNFRLGVYLGVNSLEEAGMTLTASLARDGLQSYPHMLKWLRA